MTERTAGFGRVERLKKRSEFQEVYEKGSKVRTAFFFLYILENGLPHSRLGITASRKVADPVVRNRLKRRFREIFRTNKERLVPGIDLVVNAMRSGRSSSYQELENAFVEAVERWKRERRSK